MINTAAISKIYDYYKKYSETGTESMEDFCRRFCGTCKNFCNGERNCTPVHEETGSLNPACLKYIPEHDTIAYLINAVRADYLASQSPEQIIGAAGAAYLTQEKSDAVNHPNHYNQGGIECFDALESALGEDGFEGFLVGNVINYLWRYKHKNGLEDLKKARVCLNKLIEKKGGTEE